RGDMRTDEKGLAAAQINVGLLELGAPGAHRLDFPAREREAGLVAVLDEVVVPGLAVLGDQTRCAFSFGHTMRLHGESRRAILLFSARTAPSRRGRKRAMKTVQRSATVAAPQSRMYALLLDIESYPEFVPGCTRARVESRSE